MAKMRNSFTTWDYLVFGATLAVSLGIGVYFAVRGRKQQTQDDYLRGGRTMGILPVAISILVSFMSAILILGTPAEVYTQGIAFYISTFGIILGVVLAASLFVPLIYPLGMTSAFEYLERRFDSVMVRLVGTFLMVVAQLLYMGIASFAPATALEAVTGFPVWGTIIIIGVVATVYTSIGGLKAVVWTDVFQASVMLAGMLAVAIQGTLKVGGVRKVFEKADEWDRLEFFNWSPDPTVRHTVWGLVIGGGMQWVSTYGLNQASVQRYSSLPTLRSAKISIYLNVLGIFTLTTLASFSGLVVFAYYADQDCDPLKLKLVDNPNQLIPFFVMETLAYPGVPGLFISSLFSGALSTVSSSLNALAAITWEDVLKRFLDHRLTEARKTHVVKLLVVMYGACAMGVAFVVKNLDGTVLQAAIGLIGAAGGPLTGMFVLGAFFPWANRWGAVAGAVTSFGVSMWLSLAAYVTGLPLKAFPHPDGICLADRGNVTLTTVVSMTTMAMADVVTDHERSGLETFYAISYQWYTPLAVINCLVVGLIVSFLTGPNSLHDIPTELQVPLFSRLLCCLPDSWLYRLNCRRDFLDPDDIRAEVKDISHDVTGEAGNGSLEGRDNLAYDGQTHLPGTQEKPKVDLLYMQPLEKTNRISSSPPDNLPQHDDVVSTEFKGNLNINA